MAFMDYVKQGIEILKLDEGVMTKVAKDNNATTMAVIFFAVAGIASAIGSLNIVGIIVYPIMYAIMSFIGVGIWHVIAKLFGGKAEFMEFYRAMGISYVGMWILAIPVVGVLLMLPLSLWYLVVDFKIIKSVQQLSTGKALVVLLLPMIIAMIIGTVLVFTAAAFMAAMFSSMPTGNMIFN